MSHGDIIQTGGGGSGGVHDETGGDPNSRRLYVGDTAPAVVADGLEVGDLWVDTSGADVAKRCTSISPVTFVSIEGGSSAHDVLSATHDAVTSAVTRGDVLVGNVTPLWAALGVGASATFIRSDGTDPSYSAILDADVPATHSGSAHHADAHTAASHSDQGATGAELETLTDGSDAGVLHTHTDNMVLDDFSNDIHADDIHIQARNESGGTLTKGTPVYVSGFNVGLAIVLVDKADANGSGTMPAIGLVDADIANNATGGLTSIGRIDGLDTSSFTIGDVLYVSETAGELTATRPTAVGSLVQSVAEVVRVHASLGVIEVEGASRSNDSPNSVSPAQLVLPATATPAQTAEGDAVWDSDDDLLTIGDGTGRQTFLPVIDATSDPLQDGAAADGSEDSGARKDHVHPLHHTEAHAAAHADGGADELAVQDLASDAATDGQVAKADGAGAVAFEDDEAGWNFIIDGGGSVITTGIKGDVEVPFACTITRAALFADQSGAVVIDLWKDTFANFPPTVADTITASAKPTIAASGVKDEDDTLTGWTITVAKGDIIRYNVDSIATIERLTVSLHADKT